MPQIFISYARNNEAFVNLLKINLRLIGHSIWIDQRSIVPGTEWAKEIEQGVKNADVLLLCCSTDSLTSEWVNREILTALENQVPIIPLLLEHVNLPQSVSKYQWVDFTTARYYEEAFTELIQALDSFSHRGNLSQNRAVDSAKIFLSYHHANHVDRKLADSIGVTLEQHGHTVTVDDQVIQTGTLGGKLILREIAQSDYFLILLSEQSVSSDLVALELEKAFEASGDERHRILPIRVQLYTPFPYQLKPYLDPIPWAIWNNEQDTQRIIEEIERALAGGNLGLVSLADKSKFLRREGIVAMPSPLVAADPHLEQPTGTMNPQSRFYIVRQSDHVLLDQIDLELGSTTIIKAPRQMGKSSLLMQGRQRAHEAGKAIAYLDFQLLGTQTLLDEEQFYKHFCRWIVRTLKLQNVMKVEMFWDSIVGNTLLCTEYMEQHILPALNERRIVLAIDEVDRIFQYSFRQDFFGMLRSWHNNRSLDDFWQAFDIILVISTEPYLLIENPNQSPFNVGTVISLEDFTPEQIEDLNERHGSPFSASQLIRLVTLIGGHPYLVRQALYQVATKKYKPDEFLSIALQDGTPFADHLMHFLLRLSENPNLEAGMLQIVKEQTSPSRDLTTRLQSAGLVINLGDKVIPRCQLYAEYFSKYLKLQVGKYG